MERRIPYGIQDVPVWTNAGQGIHPSFVIEEIGSTAYSTFVASTLLTIVRSRPIWDQAQHLVDCCGLTAGLRQSNCDSWNADPGPIRRTSNWPMDVGILYFVVQWNPSHGRDKDCISGLPPHELGLKVNSPALSCLNAQFGSGEWIAEWYTIGHHSTPDKHNPCRNINRTSLLEESLHPTHHTHTVRQRSLI